MEFFVFGPLFINLFFVFFCKIVLNYWCIQLSSKVINESPYRATLSKAEKGELPFAVVGFFVGAFSIHLRDASRFYRVDFFLGARPIRSWVGDVHMWSCRSINNSVIQLSETTKTKQNFTNIFFYLNQLFASIFSHTLCFVVLKLLFFLTKQ